jgi:hypothetical protein
VSRLQGEPARRDLKYAALHLGSGLELLLKERLRREDWRLLFADPGQADAGRYQRGDFLSVGIWDAIERLGDVAAVAIKQRDRERLGGLREKRNRLEHFQIVDSCEAVIASTSWALGFALDFISAELDAGSSEVDVLPELDELRQALPDLQGFVEARLHAIDADLTEASSHTTVIECPRCFQQTAITGEGLRCLFCGYRAGLEGLEQTASEWIGDVLGLSEYVVVKEGGQWPRHYCPNCERETLIDRGLPGDPEPSKRYVCLACGEFWTEGSMDTCAKCGQLFDTSDDAGTVCRPCFEGAIGSD